MKQLRQLEDPDQVDFSKLRDNQSNELIVPAIPYVGDLALNGQVEVLMVGFMNREALDMTLSTGLVTFFSRSEGKLWTKGESSGNTLEFVAAYLDCDKDTLMIQVVPNGPACHNGSDSCFELSENELNGTI